MRYNKVKCDLDPRKVLWTSWSLMVNRRFSIALRIEFRVETVNLLLSGTVCVTTLSWGFSLFPFKHTSGSKMAECQCSKCPYHGVKDQETRLKAENKNFTTHPFPAVHASSPNNNPIHSNYFHPHHGKPLPATSLHLSEIHRQDLHSFLPDSLRHVNHNGYHDSPDGCTELDDGNNSSSDINSDYDDDDDDVDDDDDDVSSCSPRRTSQSSGRTFYMQRRMCLLCSLVYLEKNFHRF